ncbi:MAG: hypothetical protein KatS3mg008_0312 [Acidimicrobiales bacterium]|nr:MAG: hypothetical protein KatS3mg008_0312 [Acidimicrobiales bacterium]
MPWCDPCDRWLSPNSLTVEGRCPECGTDLSAQVKAERGIDESVGPPWHFWVAVAALVVYLGWRLVQGIAWLIGRL